MAAKKAAKMAAKKCPFCKTKMDKVPDTLLLVRLRVPEREVFPWRSSSPPFDYQGKTHPSPVSGYRCDDCEFFAFFDG